MTQIRWPSRARSLTAAAAAAASLACAPALPAPVSAPAAAQVPAAAQEGVRLASPDGRTEVEIGVREGALHYRVRRDGRNILMPSRLGFELSGAPALRDSLRITGTARDSHDETWTQPWGEVARVRNRYNEARISVAETTTPRRRFDVVFRAFDDGVGFRYELPAQPDLAAFEITEELTEFTMANDAKAWWIPSNRRRLDRSEMLYSSSPMSLLDSVQTPLTMETHTGTMVVIHEADLVDYPRMFLAGRGMESRALRAALAPMADGVKARGRTPFATPWRTIQLADRPEDLVPAVLGLNLNPPSRIADTGWIEPMKYVGIWWGMHIGTMSWGSGPRHGATTANAKRYIDFAAANGLGGVLVEGWNIGWDGDWIANSELFSFTESHPSYDLAEVARYARSKGVDLIAHNETSGGIENYEAQMEEAYALYASLGIRAIKSGYVADEVGDGHSHYSQWAVQHHRRAIETAARHRIMLNVHEPIHDTGERRTWPNMMTREGSRGQEYNAWGGEGGNPPEHETILFFTRLLGGPMDFTPGIFDILIESSPDGPRAPEEARVRTTLAKQLALYIVLYSPMQMAADLPANYEGHPAFRFIRDVPVDWEATRVVDAEIGDHVVVARQERGGQDWYLGAVTDEDARTLEVSLDFLTPGRRYVAEIYADAPDAHFLTNPLAHRISERPVDAGTTLRLELAPGGGQAVRFRALR
ncbi:MAG TPA: glycoside hydrolase family 97 protein [Longimicrobiales bacterium]|nr:glycoside hydrolase family 97 protein [Longimicrobiales bacterium]